MASVQIAHVLVPDQQLAENSYVIEVQKQPKLLMRAAGYGPEPILALVAWLSGGR